MYFKAAFESAEATGTVFGSPMTVEELKKNMEDNCIPLEIVNWDYNQYLQNFLPERRKRMAQKIREYYFNL